MHHNTTRRGFFVRAAMHALAAGFAAPNPARAKNAEWGDLKGRFIYDGEPPERKRLKVDKDVACCGKLAIFDESLMVGPDHGLANVYVYLRSRGVPIFPEREQTVAQSVLLDNRDCIFKPHCLHVWYPRQELHIVNSDPIAQNVAFSPLGDAPANIVLAAAPGDPIEARWRFGRRQAAPVAIHCNYHPWESAFVLPLEHPYADISAGDGSFRIAKLPAGQWQFQAWHERVGFLDMPDWPKGRRTVAVEPGVNDLGVIRVSPALLQRRSAPAASAY